MNPHRHEVPSRLLLDFDKANVVTPRIEPPQPRLVVTGTKPSPVMKVQLVPLAYAKMPPYWEIQVVGTPPGKDEPTHLPADLPTEFTVELDLEGLTGTVGIVVVGAEHNERIEVST